MSLSFAEYVPLAIRTEAPQPPNSSMTGVDFRLTHAAIGICTELGELSELIDPSGIHGYDPHSKVIFDWTPYAEELGDLWWYLAIAADTLTGPRADLPLSTWGAGYDRESFVPHIFHPFQKALSPAAEMLNQAKRAMFYQKPMDLAKYVTCMSTVMCCVIDLAKVIPGGGVAYWSGVIRRQNIRKLQARYPAKFDSELAVNRDLGAEKKALGES